MSDTLRERIEAALEPTIDRLYRQDLPDGRYSEIAIKAFVGILKSNLTTHIQKIYKEWLTEVLDGLTVIAQNILEVAWHGDYSNGNEAFGTDEGRVMAYNRLKELEAQLAKVPVDKELLREGYEVMAKEARDCPACSGQGFWLIRGMRQTDEPQRTECIDCNGTGKAQRPDPEWCEHTTNPKQRRYLCSACRQVLKK